jgi:hypothetical protein
MNKESKDKYSTPQPIQVPTDEETIKWCKDNIHYGCSVQNALFKFRLWLKDRQPFPEQQDIPMEKDGLSEFLEVQYHTTSEDFKKPPAEQQDIPMVLNIGKLEVRCFDEDADMGIRVGKSGFESLSVDEAKQLVKFITHHINAQTESQQDIPMEKIKNETMNNFPRRSRLDLNEPSELAIRKCVDEVEKIGADVRLTKAVNLLHEARELVADFIDEKLNNSMKTLGRNR